MRWTDELIVLIQGLASTQKILQASELLVARVSRTRCLLFERPNGHTRLCMRKLFLIRTYPVRDTIDVHMV